jgi:hypothetical protein
MSRSAQYFTAAFIICLLVISAVPYARPLQDFLNARFGPRILIAITFLFIPAGIGMFYAFVWKQPRNRFRRIALFFLAGALYSAKLLSLEVQVERFHLMEYGLLAILILYGCRAIGMNRISFAWAIAACLALGLADEYRQFLTPNRYGEFRDVIINLEGGALALAFPLLLSADSSLLNKSPRKQWTAFLASTAVLILISGIFFLRVQVFGFEIFDPKIGSFQSYFSRQDLLSIDSRVYSRMAAPDANRPRVAEYQLARCGWFDREAREHFDKVRLLAQSGAWSSALSEYLICKKYFPAFYAYHKIQFPEDTEKLLTCMELPRQNSLSEAKF